MSDARGEIIPGVSRPPRAEDYHAIVRGLRPFQTEEEISLRASLMLMRDRAMSTKAASTTCAPSWALLDVVERVASENAMAHQMPVEMLRELRRICVQCVMAAANFDALFHPRLPLDDGEAAA